MFNPSLLITNMLILVFVFVLVYESSSADLPKETADPTDPMRGGFKSLGAVSKRSCQTFDRDGNVILTGRYGRAPATFDVLSSTEPESQLSIVFCLEKEKKASCKGRGLTLCYPAPPVHPDIPRTNLTDKQKEIQYRCGSKNGLAVSTEQSDNDETVFRIDTVFGNTYKFVVPPRKCFILWLTYDQFAGKPEEFFRKHNDIRVYPVTLAENPDLNSTTVPLEYPSNWKHVLHNVEQKPITMLWKEIVAWPHKNGSYTSVRFTAQGQANCCHLTARITGHNVVKCYHKWVQVGEECRSRHPDHVTECQFPYSVGKSNTTETSTLTVSTDDKSHEEQSERFNKVENSGFHYNTTNSTKNDEWMDKINIKKVNTSEYHDDQDIGVTGTIGIHGAFSKDNFAIYVTASLEGAWIKTGTDHNLTRDNGGDYVNETRRFDQTEDIVKQTKNVNETQNRAKNEMSVDRNAEIWKEVHTTLYTAVFENHTVRNVVNWPDILRVGQLRYVCMGQEWRLNITQDFSNNKNVASLVIKKEKDDIFDNDTC